MFYCSWRIDAVPTSELGKNGIIPFGPNSPGITDPKFVLVIVTVTVSPATAVPDVLSFPLESKICICAVLFAPL